MTDMRSCLGNWLGCAQAFRMWALATPDTVRPFPWTPIVVGGE